MLRSVCMSVKYLKIKHGFVEGRFYSSTQSNIPQCNNAATTQMKCKKSFAPSKLPTKDCVFLNHICAFHTSSSQMKKKEKGRKLSDEKETTAENLKEQSAADDPAMKAKLETNKNKEQQHDSPVKYTSKKISKPQYQDSSDLLNLVKEVITQLHPEPQKQHIRRKEENKLVDRVNDIQHGKRRQQQSQTFESLLQDVRKDTSYIFTDKQSGKRDDIAINYQSRSEINDKQTTLPDLRIDLSSNTRLGIFSADDKYHEPEELIPDRSAWTAMDWYSHYDEEMDKKLDLDFDRRYPDSAFNEMTYWTESGKIWTFPINNEEGMDEEQEVPFHMHVFLDEKLKEGNWCPKQGPIRQFMTSVITALSLNPYLTVKEKHEHIEWFRDYFTERIDTLKNLGLVDQVSAVA